MRGPYPRSPNQAFRLAHLLALLVPDQAMEVDLLEGSLRHRATRPGSKANAGSWQLSFAILDQGFSCPIHVSSPCRRNSACLVCESKSHHHHAGYPEEQDVLAQEG